MILDFEIPKSPNPVLQFKLLIKTRYFFCKISQRFFKMNVNGLEKLFFEKSFFVTLLICKTLFAYKSPDLISHHDDSSPNGVKFLILSKVT